MLVYFYLDDQRIRFTDRTLAQNFQELAKPMLEKFLRARVIELALSFRKVAAMELITACAGVGKG